MLARALTTGAVLRGHLQRVLDERRDKQLTAVPYFDGLITGETDALIASFAGEPELHHPVHGRIRRRRVRPVRGPQRDVRD
jgi:hypothetical protein